MNGLSCHVTRINKPPQTTEGTNQALLPVVDHDLVENADKVILDRRVRAVGHHQCPRLDPPGLEQRLGRRQSGCLDQDIRAIETILPVVGDRDCFAELRPQALTEGIPTLCAPGVNTNLFEAEQVI